MENKDRKSASRALRKEMARLRSGVWSEPTRAERLEMLVGLQSKTGELQQAWKLIEEVRAKGRTGRVAVAILRARLEGKARELEDRPASAATPPLSETEIERIKAVEANRPLTLPPPLHEGLQKLTERLEGVLSPTQIVLGGGTTLAMRYGHRRSTDLDLFYPLTLSEIIEQQHGPDVWEETLRELLDDEPEETSGMLGATGTIDTIPFSLFPGRIIHEGREAQPIDGQRIRAQGTFGILDGKVIGRIFERTEPNTIRDLYDLTVCARVAPKETGRMLEVLAGYEEVQRTVIESLARTPSDLYLTDRKAVIDPTYTIDLVDIGRKLIPMFATGDVSKGPTAAPNTMNPLHNPLGGNTP